jgi:hypothetical protein
VSGLPIGVSRATVLLSDAVVAWVQIAAAVVA